MSLQTTTRYDSSNPYHMYYDIDAINNNLSEKPVHLVFKENRASPYLYCPENYFASIIRFELSTTCLPLWIPQIQIGNLINETIYSITLSIGAIFFQEYIKYVPSNLNINPLSIADVGLDGQDMKTTYYYVYSYDRICNMINKAFEVATAAVNSLGLTTYKQPFILFNSQTSLFELYQPVTALYVPIFEIHFNNPLALLISSFPLLFLGLTQPNGKDWQVDNNIHNPFNPEVILTIPYLKYIQDVPTISSFNPVRSVVFSITTLPVIGTLTSQQKPFYTDINTTEQNNVNNNNSSNILTDFAVNVSNGNSYTPTIIYEPTVYRLFDMYGSTPLYNIDLSVWWKDDYSNLRKIEMNKGESGTVKIMFRRKDYNINNLFQ
mgnify:CR=1 FL=1